MSDSLAVLGAGAWGTTLAVLAARKGFGVSLWEPDTKRVRQIEELGASPSFPDRPLPASVRVSSALDACVSGSRIVILATPSAFVRQTAKRLKPLWRGGDVIVVASKGMELPDGILVSEVLEAEIPALHSSEMAILSGPNLAKELMAGMPAVSVVASHSESTARRIQGALASEQWRLYRSQDVLGVQLAGSLKNVIAIAAGIVHGLAMGDNTRSALITRGLAEMTRLAVACGAQPETLQGVAGLGDLVATCSSPLSRNQRCGRLIAEGMSLDAIQSEIHETIEGVHTCTAALSLAKRHGVSMPIAEQLSRVLFHGKGAAEGIRDLMTRELRSESEEGGSA